MFVDIPSPTSPNRDPPGGITLGYVSAGFTLRCRAKKKKKTGYKI